MKAGMIWWGQLGNSLRLLAGITNLLRDCRSAVLQVSGQLPWRQDFYEAVDIRRASFSNEKRLVRLQWQTGSDPGAFVLDELCSDRVKAEYWPGQTYAEYLGSQKDLMMNDYYVWITGIRTKGDMSKWTEFVTRYEEAAGDRDSSACFVLEYEGAGQSFPLETLTYRVEEYDCRVFALEAAAELDNSGYRSYQAEIALHLCRQDPQLCFALLETGKALLESPLETAATVFGEQGVGFQADMQDLRGAIREASIVLLYPILERYRMVFIGKHQAELQRHLPIGNSNGEEVKQPHDLEVGSLYYIVTQVSRAFPLEDVEKITLCRKVRNMLAHNRIVPIADAEQIMKLG